MAGILLIVRTPDEQAVADFGFSWDGRQQHRLDSFLGAGELGALRKRMFTSMRKNVLGGLSDLTLPDSRRSSLPLTPSAKLVWM